MSTGEVRAFFDRIADGYDDRYSADRPFHRWYFRQRLEVATEGLSLAGSRVLDVGAGTGALYAHLLATVGDSVDYLGCDISGEMLAQGPIPEAARFVGSCYELPEDEPRWDAIFLLGVTTYLPPDERDKILTWCRDHLAPGGVLVLTFSNRASANNLIRGPFMPLIRRLGKADRVAAQSFHRALYSLPEAVALLDPHFDVSGPRFLNQTFFPLNHLAPRASVGLAMALQRRLAGTRLLGLLSAEFLIRARVREDV